jgi:hypothetical protein
MICFLVAIPLKLDILFNFNETYLSLLNINTMYVGRKHTHIGIGF